MFMIDRITIYITDVVFEDIEERLDLTPYGVTKDESFIYASKYKNIRFRYIGRRLEITGSLHKFAKGNNYELFTYDEAKEALLELSDYTGISLERFIVSSIEIGVNMPMKNSPVKYIKILHSYKEKKFYPMTPLKESSEIRGYRCKLSEYDIKFYDKTYEVLKSDKIITDPPNILRYEIKLSRNQLKNLRMSKVTGKNLLSGLHKTFLKRAMNNIFNKIRFSDISINYSKMLQDDVKRYIFAVSNSYDRYLQYLKEFSGLKEHNKEVRRTKNFLKRITPLITGELEIELKEKFKSEMSKI